MAHPISPVPWATITDKEDTMRKNWKSIAAVSEMNTRLALVAAKGANAVALQKGFPDCFLAEGAEHPTLNRDALMILLKDLRRDAVIEAVQTAGLPHHRFSLRGSCCGATDQVSYARGGYSTTANGWADYFWRCSKQVGEVVIWRDAEWLVVWNGFMRGDEYSFDAHTLIIVPTEAITQ